MRVEIFSGWIQLRDPELVPERLRRPVFEKSVQGSALFNDEDMDSDTIKFFSEFNDLLAIAMISEWSFDLPVTLDGLLDLPIKAYDDVRNAVAPFIDKLIPDFGVDVNPKAITEPLNESAGS
jgi:hypothetical protein